MTEATDRLPPVLQDLEWAINSPCPLASARPPMMSWQEPAELMSAWLQQQAGNQSLLTHLLTWRQRRLGQYFERLWLCWLQDHPLWRLRLSHVPVREQGQTRGEIDLILEERASGRLLHLELAVKFYLQCPIAGRESDATWIGPGLADSLQQKYRHLIDHQLPLGRHTQITRQLGRPVDDHRILLRGRFFVPLDTGTPGQPGWLTVSECRQLPLGTRLQTLTRAQWFTGPAACPWLEKDAWLLRQGNLRRPLMVWADLPEQERRWLVVVPDDWPDQARAQVQRNLKEGVIDHGR